MTVVILLLTCFLLFSEAYWHYVCFTTLFYSVHGGVDALYHTCVCQCGVSLAW